MAEESSNIIKVNLEEIATDIGKHLSIIGKRKTDRQGSTMFTNVKLSETEQEIIAHYADEASNVFAGEVAPIVKTFSGGNPQIIEFNVTRINEGHRDAFKTCFVCFARAYVIRSILEMSDTDQAKAYETAMKMQMDAAVRIVFDKEAPISTSSQKTLADMKGEVTDEKQE